MRGILIRVSRIQSVPGSDSAMGPVFRQTGHKYGPIDLAVTEIGAYTLRKLIRSVYASPEEALRWARHQGKVATGNALGNDRVITGKYV